MATRLYQLGGGAFDCRTTVLTIVPAVMALRGHRAWGLPRWLGRLLPDLDVEGSKLAPTTQGGAA
jgi:RND superfamily putative drug exporter